MDIRYTKQAEKDLKNLPKDELAKKLILAWDPDFTKVTLEERKRMEQAEKELANGEYITHEQLMKELGLK